MHFISVYEFNKALPLIPLMCLVLVARSVAAAVRRAEAAQVASELHHADRREALRPALCLQVHQKCARTPPALDLCGSVAMTVLNTPRTVL